MKRFIILIGILCIGICVFAKGEYTYSPEYIQHLKSCTPYTDEYTTNIPTEDAKSPYLKVKSTEQILGKLNGKCYTRSIVYSYDLNKDIMAIKCGLSSSQLNMIIQKMMAVNTNASSETKKDLQDTLNTIIEDKSTCGIKNYLE